ncbi:MAG: DNA polymerase III subunit alpha [Steroidobacteraceae bacterium]
MSTAGTFVHLRLHTEFSLVDSVVRVAELMQAVAAAGMPAVALSDAANLFAMVKFYRAALSAGVQPIIGVDLKLREPGERDAPTRITLLCQNDVGYRNLARLVSRGFLEGQSRGSPLIERDWLDSHSLAGLICVVGGGDSDFGRQLLSGKLAEASRLLRTWQELFGDRLYVELQRLGHPGEQRYIEAAVSLAGKLALPVVATNDVRFLAANDFESHEARVCIQDGMLLADPARTRRYTREQYLRTPEEMRVLFADLPEAVHNSVEIARRCSLSLKLGEMRLPQFPVPVGATAEDHIRELAALGLAQRLAARPPAQAVPVYEQRLRRELDVICSMGFAGYFLIVADFIRWSRANGVPVGPGRGSGAGSLVAYVLAITDLDPIEHDLLFERFLNPERVSMPDFDVDFCMEGRDRVIAYVAEKYGRERVSQIITYGTMAAKAVVRDVGRVLGHPYGFVDRIAKLIPFELGITLDDALTKEVELKRLYESDEEVHNLIDLARSLEGLTRNAGTHAGGVVIAPSVLTDFTPLFREANSTSVVTQFDKDDVEAAGLVKFDFLGLRTLTIIERALKIINGIRALTSEAPLNITALPMDDAPTYDLMKSGRTTAVFQLESRGMKDLIRRLKPDRFEDVVALVALFRPGPLESGMVGDFISRKHSTDGTPVDYLHPDLKGVLAPTYGVILYQEQVMQIAQVLAGYTLGGADLLRRAMGKKKPEEMAKQRSIFVAGSVARGVKENIAAHIFDLMEKFAGYGFNKSHSAAYALLSYQTGWLKSHYPAAFMAAVLSSDMDHTDKIVTLIDECANLELVILPPDVNSSVYEYAVADDRTIRYGLGAIKGVGQAAVESLVAERSEHGSFASIEDLCRRLDLQRVNRRTLEALIRSGSLDSLGVNRATLMHRLAAAIQAGEQNSRASAAGQSDIFGFSPASAATPREDASLQPEWTEALRLAGERETLGVYLSGHPIARFEKDLPRLVSARLGDLGSERAPSSGESGRSYFGGRVARIAGLIVDIRRSKNRSSFTLDDRTGRMEVTLHEETFNQYRDLIAKDALVLVEGNLRFDEFSNAWRLAGKKILALDGVREQQARRLLINLSGAQAEPNQADKLVGRLAEVLAPWRPGECEVRVHYQNAVGRGLWSLPSEWRVRPTAQLLEQLEQLVGRESLQLVYGVPGALSSSAVG